MKEEDYIYFINLNEFLVCENLIRSNCIASPALIHYVTYETEYPIHNINLDNILTKLDSTNIGFSSPRFNYITMSNWARNGLKLGIGKNDTKFFTKEHVERIHRIAELEVEFEKVRREINNQLPSRLCSIYLAKNNIDGKTMLKNMFWDRKRFIISQIKINYTSRFHQADSKWISEYERTKQRSAIENYWKGEKFDLYPEYEYLLEGIIELSNSNNREHIRNNYVKE